jgi:hypothetical protein
MRRPLLHLARALVAFTLAAAPAASVAAQPRPYAEVIPNAAAAERGLFDVHRVG